MLSYLVNKSNGSLALFEIDLTIEKALNGTSLLKLSKSIEKINVITAITYLTIRLADNFNVGKKFTTDQSAVMALDLFEVFGYETLEDVVLMFKYARQGKIGDGKDFKLDSQTVFHKWIPDYLNLKAEFRENEHKKIKSDAIAIKVNDEYFKKRKENIQEKQKIEKIISFVDKITKDIDRQMLEDLIVDWTKDPVRKPYLNILTKKRLIIKSK